MRFHSVGAKRVLLAAAVLVLATSQSNAQAWPQRSISMIVSQAAGASPDVMARLLADRLSKSLGQGVIVENKPGGANVTGSLAAAKASPDGHTLFFATSAALVTNPYLIKGLPYDSLKDFVPIALISRSDQLVVVHPDVPAKTLADLIALDKAAPGKLSVGVDSPRSLAGVTAQAINGRAGMTMVLVPYPNITVALQDLLTGRIQAGILSVSIAEALVRDGKFRALATASAKRSRTLPDVPTVAQTLPGFDFSGWFMLMAPTGTPADIVTRINKETAAAVKDEKLLETASKLGFEVDVGTPEAARSFLQEQLTLWGAITRELGIEAL